MAPVNDNIYGIVAQLFRAGFIYINGCWVTLPGPSDTYFLFFNNGSCHGGWGLLVCQKLRSDEACLDDFNMVLG